MAFITRAPSDIRRLGIVAITMGIAALAISLYAYLDNVRTLAGDQRDVAGLERQLDSVRALARSAGDTAVARRLSEEVSMREYGLSRRAFHVPMRAESVRTWWTLRGAGIRWTALGVLLVALGAISARSGRRGGSAGTSTPRHGGS